MKLPLLFSLCLALSACGGGGGGSPAPLEDPNAVDPATESGNPPTTPNPDNPSMPPNDVVVGGVGPDPMAVLPALNTPIEVLASDRGSGTGSFRAINTSAMSNTSWVAMGAEVVLEQGRGSTIFRGLKGQLQAVATEGETFAGFPNNITFNDVNELLILDDSTVYADVDLSGAIEPGTQGIVRVEVDGSLTGLIKEGDLIATNIPGETINNIWFIVSTGNDAFASVQTDQNNLYILRLSGDAPSVFLHSVSNFDGDVDTQGLPTLGNCVVHLKTVAPH